MKVLLGQINTTPGDFAGNVSKIFKVIDTIKPSDNVAMAIFPELSVCGYLSRDLVFETHYVERNLLALQQIVNYSHNFRDVNIVVGYVDKNKNGIGKPFANMLAVICNGTIVGTYQKHLLPFYDVFDEGRYYEPGTDLLVLNIRGNKIGFTICEDIWNDKDMDDYCYDDNPVQSYKKCGVNAIVNISSSPFVKGKPRRRYDMLAKVANDNKLFVIYVNQIGGQDDLVFDGHSCVFKPGCCLGVVDPIADNTVDIQHRIIDACENGGRYFESSAFNKNHIQLLHMMIVRGLYDYVIKSGFKEIVLGSSGGIDSAVVAALACEAFGPENVHCIMMPSIYSSEGSVKDAQELHKNLGCKEYKVPIKHEDISSTLFIPFGIVDTYQTSDENRVIPGPRHEYNRAADENIQARLRGMMVMYFSNAFGALALTTGNKTELATGYCTLYGDMNGGFAPISDLYKMEVYELARYINTKAKKEIIPKVIIDKAPSAELAPGQTDEASLLPYPILDTIVKAYVENYIDTFTDLVEYAEHEEKVDRNGKKECEVLLEWAKDPLTNFIKPKASEDYYRIVRLININEFKRRQSAPGIKVSKVAFGSGRRLPIVKKMRM